MPIILVVRFMFYCCQSRWIWLGGKEVNLLKLLLTSTSLWITPLCWRQIGHIKGTRPLEWCQEIPRRLEFQWSALFRCKPFISKTATSSSGYICWHYMIFVALISLWYSVGYTTILLFTIALAWFVIFFVVRLGICCRHCCCLHHTYKYSRTAYALSLILLILFTWVAV
jgi:hypothetical protein